MHIIIDPGHGGIIHGNYVTPGKRSPKWKDLPQLFEGVQNREIANILKSKLAAANISFTDIIDSQTDVSRPTRIQRANTCYSIHKDAILVSIHADAAGKGTEDYPATGVSVYTSKGETKSDVLAEYVIEQLELKLGSTVKWRFDSTDGDKDKEENFDMVALTKCPAILCELGFMTNRKECELMHTAEWKENCAEAIYQGILKYYEV